MEQRSRSYQQPYMPYGQTAANGNGQQGNTSNQQQQYRQYGGSSNVQTSSTVTPTPSHQYTEWNQHFSNQDLAYQQHYSQLPRNQSAVSQDLDLEAFTADPQIIEDLDLNSLTTSVGDPWRPPGLSQFRAAPSDFQLAPNARANGVASEPLPNQQGTIDISSGSSSSMANSAYPTIDQHEEATSYSSYTLPGNDQQSNNTQSTHALSRSASAYGQSTSNGGYSTLHPQQAPNAKRRKSGDPPPPCRVPRCTFVPKNKSDAQKHQNKHTKPFRCQFQDCRKKEIGFATSNDLDRHHKSGKHGLAPKKGSGKGYVCAACQISPDVSPKWWPRLDNFKAHIGRRHKGSDVNYLVKLSEREYRPSDAFDSTSSYFPGSSIADQDLYQRQDLSSPTGTGQLPNQGENLSWPDQPAQLPSIDEVLAVGVGEAQHLADDYTVRPGAVAGADRSYGDEHAGQYAGQHTGLSLLGAAAAMTSPTMAWTEVPTVRVTQHDAVGTKRTSDDQWEQGPDKRQRNGSFLLQHQDASETEGPFQCDQCKKWKKRKCDLRKHEKRHYRPYGCTFPRCYYRQGSRSDWKRHEERQHSVTEAWKCTLPTLTGSPCHSNFQTRKSFVNHLGNDHSISDNKTVQHHCDAYYLGRDGHHRFWCGFCNAVVQNEAKSMNPARTARDRMFDHIGDHFDKEGRHIQNYICQELKRSFGELNREEKKKAKADYDRGPVDSGGYVGDLPSSAVYGLEADLFS